MSARPSPQLAQVIEPELGEGWAADGFGAISVIAEQLPDPASLPPGTWVGVAASAPRTRGIRTMFRRPAAAALAVRCTALLARGYRDVGAGADERGAMMAWGRT